MIKIYIPNNFVVLTEFLTLHEYSLPNFSIVIYIGKNILRVIQTLK